MESIILTISIILGALSPTQLLEEVTFRDLDQAQLQLDSIGAMNLSDSDKAKYLFFQGYVYAKKHDIARAIISYRESIRYYEAIEKKDPGKNTEALFYYRYHAVHHNLGKLYFVYNSPEMAMTYYEEALKYASEEYLPKLYYSIAQAQDKMGNTQKAIDFLLNSFKLSVAHGVNEYRIRSQIMLAQILSDGGRYQESLEHLTNVLVEDSLSASLEIQARNTLGITTWLMKDYRTAEFNFNRILEIGQAQNQFVALENLCEMYLEQGFVNKSIEAGTKAEKEYKDQINSPDDARLFSYLSNAYLAIDNDAKALAYSNKFRDYMLTYYDQQQTVIEDGDAYRIQSVTENYESELKAAEDRKKTIQANITVTSIILITFLSFLWHQQSKKQKMVRKITEELLA